MIDSNDLSGNEKHDISPSNIVAHPTKKVDDRLHLIMIAESFLERIDRAWDVSVGQTALTINHGVLKPIRWCRGQVGEANEKAKLIAKRPMNWVRLQFNSLTSALNNSVKGITEFGVSRGKIQLNSIGIVLSALNAYSKKFDRVKKQI